MEKMMSLLNEAVAPLKETYAFLIKFDGAFEETLSWDAIDAFQKAYRLLNEAGVSKNYTFMNKLENAIKTYSQSEEYAWWATCEMSSIIKELELTIFWQHEHVHELFDLLKLKYPHYYNDEVSIYWGYPTGTISIVRAKHHTYELRYLGYKPGTVEVKQFFGKPSEIKADDTHSLADKISCWIESNYLAERAAVFTNWLDEKRRIKILNRLFDAADKLSDYIVYNNGKCFMITLQIPNITIKEEESGKETVIMCNSTLDGFFKMRKYIYAASVLSAEEAKLIKLAKAGIKLFNYALKRGDIDLINTRKASPKMRKIARYIWQSLDLNWEGERWIEYHSGDDPFEDYGWVPQSPIRKGTSRYNIWIRDIVENIDNVLD